MSSKHIFGDLILEHLSVQTPDDLVSLPGDATYELYQGKVLQQPMTMPYHGSVCQNLGVLIDNAAYAAGFKNKIIQNGLFTITPPGTAYPTTFAPDVAIMRGAVAPQHVPYETPLLAIEVISPSQPLPALEQKGQAYLQAGVEMVWIIQPAKRIAVVLTAQQRSVVGEADMLTGGTILPWLSIPLAWILDGRP